MNELTELHSFSEYRDLLVEKINLRFGHLFKDDNHILSAATHPQFKLNRIEDEITKLEVKKKLDNLLTLDGKQQKLISPVESSNFLNFNTNSSCLTEVDHFLTNESRDFKCFDKCPNIKSLFLKYNTTLPSSAPVEQLFSIAALVLSCRRTRLTDSRFETLLLLKMNLKVD